VRVSEVLYRTNQSTKRNCARPPLDLCSAPLRNDLTKLAKDLTKDGRVKHFRNLKWQRPFLSKSRYMGGRQCPKKLWQTVYDPEPAEEPLLGTIKGMGIEVGIKARLHQTSFRDAVLSAYRGRCAICHLPEPRLLDAAHIIMDADEQLGQPVISNGLPLTKLHHAAFDAHLIGVDPDYRIHVSDRLLEIHDGPFLELGLKSIAGTLIDRPRRLEDRPDRDRLALRFEEFKKAA
jgi:hypothetical protein